MSDSERYGLGARRMVQAVSRAQTSVPVLFVGEPGAGQEDAAWDLVAMYLCKSPMATGACGNCAACRNWQKQQSPDVLLVEPGGKTNSIRIYKITGAERPREDPAAVCVADFVRVGPVQASLKVVCIRGAERLGHRAANALLKTLEEAPDYVRFVLTSDAAGTIIQTIRSRCCLVPCDYKVPDGISEAALALSAGTPVLALKLNSELYSDFSHRLWNWISALPNCAKGSALKLSEQFQEFAAEFHSISGSSEMRTTRCELLQMFCNGLSALIRNKEFRVLNLLEPAIEAHRACAGNVQFSYLSDALFARL